MFHLLGISILNQSIQKTGFPVTNLPLKILIWHCPSFELKQKFRSFSTKGNFTSSAIKFSFTPDRASNWVSVSVCVYVLKVYVHCVCVCVCVRGREQKGEREGKESRESVHLCAFMQAFFSNTACVWINSGFISWHIGCVSNFCGASLCMCGCLWERVHMCGTVPIAHFPKVVSHLCDGRCSKDAGSYPRVAFLPPPPNHYTNKAELP